MELFLFRFFMVYKYNGQGGDKYYHNATIKTNIIHLLDLFALSLTHSPHSFNKARNSHSESNKYNLYVRDSYRIVICKAK